MAKRATFRREVVLLTGALTLSTGVSSADASGPVRVQALSPVFTRLVDSAPSVDIIETKAHWAEGPLCLPNGDLIWSDVEGNSVMRWAAGGTPQVWLEPSDHQNGHALDLQGRVVAASHGKRAIVRREDDGKWKIVVDSYQGEPLNSPNDLVVASDGAIWFSDPEFGIKNPKQGYGGTPRQGGDFLYRYDPASRNLKRLDVPGLKSPNGLAFSPDEKFLYVADSQLAHDFDNPQLAHQILRYTVEGDSLSDEQVFAKVTPGIPDGLKVDGLGNVWSSSREGVQVFSPSGSLLGKLLIDAKDTGNLAFCTQGSHNWLYVTAANLVLRISVKVGGAGVAAVSSPE
ncbi:SMP-30/gluconolactonase/LRE family protein [Pseudomonas oryzihabitans]|uniref:Gluconolactonase n=1 Tax=Pseudomonas oryzihabitans TaxID=47885 RepID=A0AAJ2BTJ3_9PSED|nr:SMP-30/gluconolactonase/LRE family protein [Pseudomonas psychrotolerans]MDR6236184.1 gluconolactonase [Pseudomonas psychrotolerans]MDR6354484.1 gluconolactonase [Pseudomonas psychrotolerans]